MFILRSTCVAVLSLGFGLLVSADPLPTNKTKPPSNNKTNPPANNKSNPVTNSKTNPPNTNPPVQQRPQQPQQPARQHQSMLPLLYLGRELAVQQHMMNLQNLLGAFAMSRFQMPFVPAFAPPYAYLPGYFPNVNTPPLMSGLPPTIPGLPPTSQPGTSLAGFGRELVLDLADTTTYSQLKPGSATQLQPATTDALKVGQVISVLVKNDPTADKPGTWSFPAQITGIDDGNPKKLTVMAKLDSTQEGFTPATKIITAVTIRSQPTVDPK